MSEWRYRAKVIRVVDGDTVDLQVDLGFRATFADRFRLDAIDAPERGQENWAASTLYLVSRLPEGTYVDIETRHPRVRDPRDSFGRWLATIYLGETNINQEMVEKGYAVPYQR